MSKKENRINNNANSGKSPADNQEGNPKNEVSAEVILKFTNGDHRAFETIFNTFYSRVNTFIKMLTRTDHLAEELTQQLFVDLWESRNKINPDKNLNAYIYTMARNAAITALKQQSRFEPTDIFHSTEAAPGLTDDQLIAKETALLVQLAIAGMPEKRRKVFEMSRFEYKTNEEIARELNISRKVVEKHLRLAIGELRKIIGVVFLLL